LVGRTRLAGERVPERPDAVAGERRTVLHGRHIGDVCYLSPVIDVPDVDGERLAYF
jgi:hypothetical protein